MRSTLLTFALVPMLLAACGGSDDGGGSPTSCGISGQKTGAECSSLADCGAGASNEVEVVFCTNCVPRADTHFCEAGTCRMFDPELTNVNFTFSLPASVTTGKSFTIATLNPTMADGGTLTCAALLSTCMSTGNAALNARNSRFNQLPAGDLFMGQISIDPGQGRLLFIQVTDGQQGTGKVLAHGCKDAIDVVKGQTQTVALDLVAVP